MKTTPSSPCPRRSFPDRVRLRDDDGAWMTMSRQASRAVPIQPVLRSIGAISAERPPMRPVEDNMRNVFLAVLFAVTFFRFDECGPGCHSALYGGCVVDGWSVLAVRNQCPFGTRPRPPCPYGYAWKKGACFVR